MGCPQNTFAVVADPPVAEQDDSVFGGILKETKQRLGAAKKSLWKLFLKKIAANGATDGISAGAYPREYKGSGQSINLGPRNSYKIWGPLKGQVNCNGTGSHSVPLNSVV